MSDINCQSSIVIIVSPTYLVHEAVGVGVDKVVPVASGVLLSVADHPLHQLLVPRLTAVVAIASRRAAGTVRRSACHGGKYR